MRICWDNLENVYLTKNGNFRYKDKNDITHFLKYFDFCKECKEPYLAQIQNNGYCSRQCSIKNNEKMFGLSGKRNSFFGKKHTKKSKEKMRQAHLGNKTTMYNYPNRSGPNNSNWKGGVSENRKYYRTKEYETWRKLVFEKDDYICWACGKKGGNLQAHHIYEVSKFPHLIYKVSNGITLHEKYHKSIRGKETKFRSDYEVEFIL